MLESKSIWDEFTNKYSLSKTLRFELKPVGKTLDKIKEKNLIEEDEEREKDFNQIKKIMDEFYKCYVDKCLNEVRIRVDDLEVYAKAYFDLKKDSKKKILKEHYARNQNRLRKQIYNEIKKSEDFNKLFGKEFINEILPLWLDKNNREKEKDLVIKFSKWVTYFKGFFENRKNVFSDKEIPTSIIYRIVHDNLPKYLDNYSKIQELKQLSDFDCSSVHEEFKNEMNNQTIFEFFSLSNFCEFMNQSGIDKYNLIIGGKSEDGNSKIKGLNELINEYSQKFNDKNEQKKIRKLKLMPLFKQILSDRESTSFVLEFFKDEKDLFENIDEFYTNFNNLTDKLKLSIKKLSECDLNNIYIKNDTILTKISQDIFGDWNKINEGLKKYFEFELNKEKNTEKQLNDKIDSKLKSKFFSIREIENGINALELENKKSIIDYFLNFNKNYEEKNIDLFEDIKNKFVEYKKINRDNEKKLNDDKSQQDVEIIKLFLDSVMALYHFLKPLQLNFKKSEDEKGSDALEIDSDFYNDFNSVFDKLGEIIPLYNKVRNFVTKKPFSTKKFKLNFDNSTLANGWDLNKEKDNYSIILRRMNLKNNSYDYYLAVMSGTDKKIFEKISDCSSNTNCYEKMCYKLISDPNKMFPKVFLSKKGVDTFKPSSEILNIYKNAEHIKGDKFNIDSCHKLIDYFKSSIPSYKANPNDEFGWDVFNIKFSKTSEYNDISDFYREVENQSYKVWFKNIYENYITQLINEGKLYLFQIWNKDFSEYSKGRQNIHTIYWKNLFSEENLNDVVYKLNGEAELFYRKASIKENITHPKNVEIENKNPIKNKMKSCFKYDLIKDKRYTKDKFFFHCPITLNFKAKDQSKVMHKLVNKYIYDTDKKINVIGIDRGERNLAYYTLIDSSGKIVEQKSFNIISDDLQRKFDYQERLDQIEGDRDTARKNWKKINNIKEMKTGYLSHVIHKISKLAIENNAIIVLEDLNFGFKRGRFKIEKQIYQKFEKMLIDKLNYLVFKDFDKTKSGGYLKAYQLTNKFDSFKKLGKQSGIIYYVDAYKTSKICPKTGFVNLLYPKFDNIKKSQDFFSKFKYIKYSNNENIFEFNFNYSNFFSDDKTKLIRDNWSIWSNGIKLDKRRNKDKNNSWETIQIDVTSELKTIFSENNINFDLGNNIVDDIVKIENKSFYESLIHLLKLILQLRNSYSDYEVKEYKKKSDFRECDYDYILSCVKDKNGNFFDSRFSQDYEVKDADANGAYHIALKGLIIIDKIKELDNFNEKTKVDLNIPRNEFLNYVICKKI
jgi:CRISPR-associated protein Cpf1